MAPFGTIYSYPNNCRVFKVPSPPSISQVTTVPHGYIAHTRHILMSTMG